MSYSNKIPMCSYQGDSVQSRGMLNTEQSAEPLLKVVSVSKRRTPRTQHLKGCIFKLMVSTASLAHIRCTLTFSRSLSLCLIWIILWLHWDLVQNICICNNHPFFLYPKHCLLHFTALLVICVQLRVKWQGCLILLIFSLWKSRWLYGWRSVRGMWT